MADGVKRKYTSGRRQEQAAETRRAIIASARELFVEQGYGQTTLAQVAAGAGVAVETIYASFRSKPNLLRHVWYVDFRGDDEDVTLFDRPEMQAILAEPDLPTRIRLHATFVTATNRRMAPLVEMLTGAASTEAGAQEMLDEWAARRLDVATQCAKAARRSGQLTVAESLCRDILYSTMDGALWQRLVVERRWSDKKYAAWLADLWTSQFTG